MNNKGFTIYLTFLVTTVVFILVSGTQQMSLLVIDSSRSVALETIAFHAAEGGIERGTGRLRGSFEPFLMSYRSNLSEHRQIKVKVEAFRLEKDKMEIVSEAKVFEGSNLVATRKLRLKSVENYPGRPHDSSLVEA